MPEEKKSINLTRQQKNLIRILVGSGLFIAAWIISAVYPQVFGQTPLPSPLDGYPAFELLLFLIPYAILGYPVLLKAFRNIGRGHIFDENFLMGVATIGALCLAEFPEAVAVILFYQVGELFEDYAVDKSRDSIAQMMDIAPDIVMVERDGKLTDEDPYDVDPGTIIVVKPGDRIALDGVVVEGEGELDTAALTGESLPRRAVVGDEVNSGSINLSGVLRIRTTKPFEESTVSRILELVENAADEKAPMENFITRFARYYTPIVCGLALAIAVIPPLFTGFDWGNWVERGLIFLVVSCPCALVISIPLGFFGGIGGASRRGIMVKGGNHLEALYHVRTIFFDKTGTLTKGSFAVDSIDPAPGFTAERLLDMAAHAEAYSTHPIGLSVRTAQGDVINRNRIQATTEVAGRGLDCVIDGMRVLAGNARLMQENGIGNVSDPEDSTVLHLSIDGDYAGSISVSDTIKDGSAAAIRDLKSLGVAKTVMLTGDRTGVAAKIASKLGLDDFHADLLPQDKMKYLVEEIEHMPKGEKVAFVGDGINDAPSLIRSDVGVAMGAMGSDAAIEAADVVLMDDNPERLVTAVKISRKTMRIVYANVVFALGVKIIILALAALGMANMWIAIFGDVGVSILAIMNSMRTLNFKE